MNNQISIFLRNCWNNQQQKALSNFITEPFVTWHTLLNHSARFYIKPE